MGVAGSANELVTHSVQYRGMHSRYVAPFRVPARDLAEVTTLGSPLEETRSLAKALYATIGVACALARMGRNLDLTGLDTQAGFICARALDLSPEDGRELHQELIAIRLGLASLAGLMRPTLSS
jgi:hypothetical protein